MSTNECDELGCAFALVTWTSPNGNTEVVGMLDCGRHPDDAFYRLVGGKITPSDESAEDAVKRMRAVDQGNHKKVVALNVKRAYNACIRESIEEALPVSAETKVEHLGVVDGHAKGDKTFPIYLFIIQCVGPVRPTLRDQSADKPDERAFWLDTEDLVDNPRTFLRTHRSYLHGVMLKDVYRTFFGANNPFRRR